MANIARITAVFNLDNPVDDAIYKFIRSQRHQHGSASRALKFYARRGISCEGEGSCGDRNVGVSNDYLDVGASDGHVADNVPRLADSNLLTEIQQSLSSIDTIVREIDDTLGGTVYNNVSDALLEVLLPRLIQLINMPINTAQADIYHHSSNTGEREPDVAEDAEVRGVLDAFIGDAFG